MTVLIDTTAINTGEQAIMMTYFLRKVLKKWMNCSTSELLNILFSRLINFQLTEALVHDQHSNKWIIIIIFFLGGIHTHLYSHIEHHNIQQRMNIETTNQTLCNFRHCSIEHLCKVILKKIYHYHNCTAVDLAWNIKRRIL